MSSGEIITRSLVKTPLVVNKFEIDLIHENTDENGDILCIKCESGWLHDYEKPITVGLGFSKPKSYKLQTYYCTECEYIHIDDNHTKQIRKFLSK